MPLSPLWAKLPKRHCDDCGKLYKPVKPSREGERWFCSPNCRKSYHKHGGAYRKLRGEMRKMIDREMRELKTSIRQIVREELRRVKVEQTTAGELYLSLDRLEEAIGKAS